MTLDECKALDDLILSELNIKRLIRMLYVTEKGNLDLVYCHGDRSYHWELGGVPVAEPTPRMDAMIPRILEEWWNEEAKK